MRIHYLQHVPFEGLGSMAPFLTRNGHSLSRTALHEDQPLPDITAFDALIVMGGPMGVHDEDRHPWLHREKSFIGQVIRDTDKPVLGICLGAQLIAAVLGAAVTRNRHREIGWFPLALDPVFKRSRWGDALSDGQSVFHWHGDTFELPDRALPVGSSAATRHQGFVVDDRVLGLQFHLETTPEGAEDLIAECGDELDGSRFVQNAGEITGQPSRFAAANQAMATLLDVWLATPGRVSR